MFLNGSGGTGKSHVIKLIHHDVVHFLQQSLKLQPDEPLVLLTAPTGLAAFNIGGITLHSAFMLHQTCENADITDWEKKSTMHTKLANLMLCVIDEISMVGFSTFQKFCSTLKQIKQSFNDWGGVSILAVGDMYQLPQVGKSPVLKGPNIISNPGQLSPPLRDDFLIHDLDEIMRQKDKEFADALNKICTCVLNEASEVDKMLQSREVCVHYTYPNYPKDAMHVYARDQYCSEWNNIHLNSLDGNLYCSESYDVSKDKETNLCNIDFPKNPRKKGSLLKTFQFKVGARVMLTTNVDVANGLTNGAMGTITGVILKKK